MVKKKTQEKTTEKKEKKIAQPLKIKKEKKEKLKPVVKIKLGRPSKYDPKFCKQILEFFSRPYTIKKKIVKNSVVGPVEVEVEVVNDFPTFELFAVSIGVDDDTLERWANDTDDAGELKHPDFCGAYKKAKKLQKNFLIRNGMQGFYSGAFPIFVAKNVTDMKDKQDLDIAGEVNVGVAAIAKAVKNQLEKKAITNEDDFADFEAISDANTGQSSPGNS